MKETITWKDASKELPDSSRGVLARGGDFCDKACLIRPQSIWVSINGYSIASKITHWAEMPKGPRSRKGKR